MDALLKWLGALAIGSFTSGAVVGHVVTDVVASSDLPPSEQAFLAELTEMFGLDARQQHRLHLLLQHAQEEENATWGSVQMSQLPPEVSGRLKAQRSRTEQRFRALLDDEQRARYDRDSRPFGADWRR
ncbi:MAG: hypothetical protein WAT39_21910 [Planctomycetota bacterium]